LVRGIEEATLYSTQLGVWSGVLVAFVLFWIQLVINAIWSVIFFGMKSKGGGVITIILLWLLILATIVTSFRVSGWAGALLVPYIVWVSIASYLNIGIWILNKPVKQIAKS
jgi:tryptophan-rich sensory protein